MVLIERVFGPMRTMGPRGSRSVLIGFVGTLEDEQTIFLMFFPRLDVPITASSLDHNGPARNLAQEWAGVFCERMEGEAVDGNECNLDSLSALESFHFSS
jgi:hypothetical protein